MHTLQTPSPPHRPPASQLVSSPLGTGHLSWERAACIRGSQSFQGSLLPSSLLNPPSPSSVLLLSPKLSRLIFPQGSLPSTPSPKSLQILHAITTTVSLVQPSQPDHCPPQSLAQLSEQKQKSSRGKPSLSIYPHQSYLWGICLIFSQTYGIGHFSPQKTQSRRPLSHYNIA